jgi:hypothetical protein
MVRLQPRSRTVLAWSLWLASMSCCAGGLLAALLWVRPLTLGTLAGGAATALAFPLGYASVGLVLNLRRPTNPIGWLYAASGLAWALEQPFGPWLQQLIRDHWPLPAAAQLAAVAGGFLWAPGVGFGITLPFLLLPDGRLRSRGWRVVVVTAVTGAGIVLAAGSLMPGRLGETSIANPFALAGPAGTVATVLFDAGLALHAASAVAALVSLVLRFWASVGVERQQLRWVAAGGAAAVAGLLPTILVGLGIAPTVNDLVVYPAVLCVPVTVAVAVLRYRLWDLDRLISRTVTYAMVTGLLVLPYLLVVPAAGRLALAPAASGGRPPRWPPPPCSSRCADGSRRWSTGGSTAAATTPPAPWTGSRPACATRSTWTPCAPSCWQWSTRPCSRPRPRCGCAHRQPHGHPPNRSASELISTGMGLWMCSRYSVRPGVSVGRGTTVYGSEARNSATSRSSERR